jgi:RNA polymerase sigma-70 factor (ECF subfamily)
MGEAHAVKMRTESQTAGKEEISRWVEKAKAGDQGAFEKLYRAHSDRIHALCWRLCGGDKGLAEDLVQESFIRAWSKLHLFRGESAFGTWMHRLAANVALSDRRIRLKRVTRELPLDENLERTIQGAKDISAGLNADLEQAIAGLPERARSVLVLYDVEGYRHAEIAELTGMAVGSSKAQLHRARKLVRKALEK